MGTWDSNVSLPQMSEGYVTKFAPQKALKLITSGKLTFGEGVAFLLVRWFHFCGRPPYSVFLQSILEAT